jgi:uncharacterized Zn ribbon protein
MKRLFSKLMFVALAAMTFTACEDVPEPYDKPGTGTNVPGTGGGDIEGAKGDGTLDNPFNAVAALNACKKLAAGEVSSSYYYIEGKVASIATDKNGNVLNFDQGTYGNASFYLSEDGSATNQFYCYRVLYLGNQKWTQGAGDILKVGDEVIVCAKLTMYNTTPETQQNEGFVYSLNGKSEGGEPKPDVTGDPKGTGTLADPFNVAAALAKCKEVGETGTADNVYAKGFVKTIKSIDTSYGNAEFTISDDKEGSNELTVYRALGPGNKKITDANLIKTGDTVIICGKLVNFKGNTPEFTQGCYIYSINDEGGNTPDPDPTPGEAKGDGSLENPFNAVAATNEAKKLADKAVSEQAYYIKGKVASIATDKSGNPQNYDFGTYGNATFYISDDGSETNTFYIYRALYLGNKKWEAGVGEVLKVGDEVIVYAKLTMYGSTPETKQGDCYLYSLNGVTEAGEPTPGPDPTPDPDPTPTGDNLLANAGFESWTSDGAPENWKTASSAGNATLTQSTDARSGSYSVSVGFNTSQNKRLAYKELTLKAGTYTFSFYAKSTTAEKSQTQAGHVVITDGQVGNYKYGGYVTLTNTEWTQASTTFTLAETSTVCVVMMNPKTSNYATAQNILVDDASLVTTDGGLAE